MQLPPVVQAVVANHTPGGDLLADVGRGQRELRLDLEDEEGLPGLDSDVVVAVNSWLTWVTSPRTVA